MPHFWSKQLETLGNWIWTLGLSGTTSQDLQLKHFSLSSANFSSVEWPQVHNNSRIRPSWYAEERQSISTHDLLYDRHFSRSLEIRGEECHLVANRRQLTNGIFSLKWWKEGTKMAMREYFDGTSSEHVPTHPEQNWNTDPKTAENCPWFFVKRCISIHFKKAVPWNEVLESRFWTFVLRRGNRSETFLRATARLNYDFGPCWPSPSASLVSSQLDEDRMSKKLNSNFTPTLLSRQKARAREQRQNWPYFLQTDMEHLFFLK